MVNAFIYTNDHNLFHFAHFYEFHIHIPTSGGFANNFCQRVISGTLYVAPVSLLYVVVIDLYAFCVFRIGQCRWHM